MVFNLLITVVNLVVSLNIKYMYEDLVNIYILLVRTSQNQLVLFRTIQQTTLKSENVGKIYLKICPNDLNILDYRIKKT